MTRKPRVAIAQTMRVCIEVALAVAFDAVATSGCRTEDSSGLVPQDSPPPTDLPCDVESVLATRCWACHGRTPLTILADYDKRSAHYEVLDRREQRTPAS